MDPSRKISTEYDFSTSRILGHGASSTVRLAVRRRDGVQVAVKTIAKHEALRFRRMRQGARRHLDEWELLRSLKDNPHVVSLLDVFETDDEIQLVMEYCQGGELFDVIQRKRNQALDSLDKVYRYSESKAARIVSQMLSVLVELHSRGIVHRDVKPENILLTNDSQVCAKLSDFGTSRELHPEMDSDSCSSDGEASPLTPQSRKRAYSAVGSNFYAAPEVRSGEGYDTAVDLYSLGVTLYVLLCGFPPSFSTNDEDDVVAFPSSCDLSDDVKRLIRKMLDQDASRRITALGALQDVWIVRQTKSSPVYVPATRTILSPSAPRPVVDMELVRSRLFKGLDSSSDEEESDERGFKRRKVKDDFCLSMADFIDGVASAAASAEAAAAGVFDDDDSICIVEDDDGVERDDLVTSPFETSFTALSV
jgi:serine/threonine protein kinase